MPERFPKLTKNREEALILAMGQKEIWDESEILALDAYLVFQSKRLAYRKQTFLGELKRLTKKDFAALQALGEKYGLYEGYNRQEETLKVFCRRNNIELIP